MRVLALFLALFASSAQAAWFKGNTHAHTLQSDGDSTPMEVAQWYRDHGYSFLVITDHDQVTRIENPPLLLIPGEEITDRFEKKPLHVNAIGLREVVKPQGGQSVVETLQRDIDAARKAGGIAAINHPNFGWAFGSEELLNLEHLTLLEIASGHPYVNMDGPPSVEEMWDVLLTAGRRVWGIAVDDSHHLKRPWDKNMAPPGKAWIVVRAEKLDQSSIMRAIERGDFYASNGVELADYVVANDVVTISIRESGGARYRTQFIGPGGRVLHQTMENPATFTLPAPGAKGYVRVKVIDSNGQAAWCQPILLPSRR